jgi:LuxR family transcriptional regulator, maltose regulon positive regulatory protein
MQNSDRFLRTKIHLPSTRLNLVLRSRLLEKMSQGLQVRVTLVIAPAGFGKTTLVMSCIAGCEIPIAWLSLDKNDNDVWRFLNYVVAALQETDNTIGREAAQLLAALQQTPPETILTSLINDLDTEGKERILVLDDYHVISSQVVHEVVVFLLEHCPNTLHLVIASRSDPPLHLARLRARAQIVELRAADLRFTEAEAAHFLNDVMGLRLDAKSVAVLEERTEGWIAGLQMAALSMRDRMDVRGFIETFSGTNRYILDYLVEEVLAGQPIEIQRFLLYTSILERLTAPLCESILDVEKLQGPIKLTSILPSSKVPTCQQTLEHLEHTNLFVVPLDDERIWYRYHHLFADLLRARLDQLYPGLAPQLHARAAAWHEQNGSILESIHHASLVPNDEMVERLIKQNYMEMMNRGEMSWVRFWMGSLSKDLVYRRPWLCLYEAMNCSWFGQLEEANVLLQEAEKSIRAKGSASGAPSMLGYHAYVKSRVIAMQGDTGRAIEYCLAAREHVPADSLELQIDFSITLGYEYFLYGDFEHAKQTLHETIQSGSITGAINNPVAAYCLLARLQMIHGRLHEADDLFQKAARMIKGTSGQNLGVLGLVEVGTAALLYEWNYIDTALVRLKKGLECLPMWGKVDDLCLAYTTLSRIQFAQGNRAEAIETIKKAAQLTQTCGVFSEARSSVEASQVKMWLAQEDWPSIDRWVATLEKRFGSPDLFRYEDELAHIMQARVFLAQNKIEEAIPLLSCSEKSAESRGRAGRLIEILALRALALQAAGNTTQADLALTKSLALAKPNGYVRVFLDEGQPMQIMLAAWLARSGAGPLREYVIRLLSRFNVQPQPVTATQAKVSLTLDASALRAQAGQNLVESLSTRELEVLQLMSLGKTNQEIAQQLIVARGTIKAHAASIYRKLDATNRTEAVARARQLGILA